jgi:hypothetical protein
MWIAWGNMRAGKVEACDGSAVVTDFFHVCFLPIWPRRSWVLPARLGPFEDPDDRVDHVTPLPRLHARSVWLGIARTWLLVFAIGGALSFLVRATSDEIVGNAMIMNGACVPIRLSDVWMEDSGTLFAGGLAIVLGALGAGLLAVGRLNALGRAQRRVYALVTGLPVDPIHLAPPQGLRESVIDAANSVMAHGGYRTTRQPEHDWPAIALDPSITDCMLVARAFVLSRALQATTTPARAAALREAHASLSRSALLAMLFTLGMVLMIALAHFFADGAN